MDKALVSVAVGAVLTFVVQLIVTYRTRQYEARTAIIAGRRTCVERLLEATHRLGQTTGDYLEASLRAPLHEEQWNELCRNVTSGWFTFSDAMVHIPPLGDQRLLHAAREVHALFAYRINCLYAEHPQAIPVYRELVFGDGGRAHFPETDRTALPDSAFRWDFSRVIANRDLYATRSHQLDNLGRSLIRADHGRSLRQLLKIAPAEPGHAPSVTDEGSKEAWPRGSFMALTVARQSDRSLGSASRAGLGTDET